MLVSPTEPPTFGKRMSHNADSRGRYWLVCLQCDRTITPNEVHEANPDNSPYGPMFFHSCGDAVAIRGDFQPMPFKAAVRHALSPIDSSRTGDAG